MDAETKPKSNEAVAGAFRSEIRDGMAIDWEVPITMDDGLVLRADLFRPPERAAAACRT